MRTVEDELRQRIQAGHLEFVHHLDKPPGAGIVAGTQRVDIALQFDRKPRTGAHEVEEGLVRFTLIETFDDRYIHALFVDRPPLWPHAKAADIDDVGGVRKQADDLPPMERRRHDGQVVQVASAQPWVVGDVVVARPHRRRGELLQEMPDALSHRVDMARRASDRLSHHPPMNVENPGGQIARLPHGGRKRGADHDLRLLLHHRDQAVPHDLTMDLREGVSFIRHGAGTCWLSEPF